MSKTLRHYSCLEHFTDGADMSITATMQGEWGNGVQFTIHGSYCVLAENQVKDLIKVLQKRLKCIKGYSATDWGKELTINPEKSLKEANNGN